jgi:chemotaxis protein CheY-P-specific phosphatase CheC
MEPDRKEQLDDMFCQTLEQYAFMFGEQVEKEEFPIEDDPFLFSGITFTGPLNGKVSLAIPKEQSAELASNVLGLSPDDPEVEQEAIDSFKEMVNVVCGHVLTTLAGEEAIFNQSVPDLLEIGVDEVKKVLDDESTLAYLVDDIPMLFQAKIQ